MRRIGWLLSIFVLALTGVLGTMNGASEWGDAGHGVATKDAVR